MRQSAAIAFGAVILAATVLRAGAEEHVVTQSRMQFQMNNAKVEALTVKGGDTVVFRNDDRLAHSIFSRTPGMEFDLGAMRAGTSAKHTFAKPGTADIECAMHPSMKMKVTVAP